MNQEKYRQRLVGEEQRLSARVDRAMAAGRESADGAAHDVGDDSSSDALKDEQFAEADGGTANRATPSREPSCSVLRQVGGRYHSADGSHGR